MARKAPETKAPQDIVQAAENTEMRIRGFQQRLAERASHDRIEDDLDRELAQYFAASVPPREPNAPSPMTLRSRVIDLVVDKILQKWDRQLAEQLADRIYERLRPPEERQS